MVKIVVASRKPEAGFNTGFLFMVTHRKVLY